MFQLIYAYVAGLGPYVAIALVLGVGIPFLLAVTRPSRWLVAFTILFLSLYPLGGADLGGQSEGSMFRQIGWSSAFLVALFFAVRSQGKLDVPWRWIPVSYLLLLAYALLTIAWAEHPSVSAKRAVQLLGVLFVALALVRHRIDGNALNLFAWPGLFFLVLGVLALAAPSFSFDMDGNYKGFTITKNGWGQFGLLMTLVFMFLALKKSKPRLNWWLFALASVSLFATRSATSIMIYVIATSIVLCWAASKRYGNKVQIAAVAITIMSITAMCGYVFLQGDLPLGTALDAGLGSFGKDATLTGRTDLWRMMGYEIARHPWLGTGFGSFWLGLEGPSYAIVQFFSWRPGQAHNGYIDVVNELGYVGLALLLFVLVVHLRDIYWINRRGDGLTAVFHLALLVSALLLNASETSFMRTTHLWWIILTTSIISTHMYSQMAQRTKPIASVPGPNITHS